MRESVKERGERERWRERERGRERRERGERERWSERKRERGEGREKVKGWHCTLII